jgi:hypothetical protein
MSLGDAIAALFRPRPKKRAFANPSVASGLPAEEDTPMAVPPVQELAANSPATDAVGTPEQVH